MGKIASLRVLCLNLVSSQPHPLATQPPPVYRNMICDHTKYICLHSYVIKQNHRSKCMGDKTVIEVKLNILFYIYLSALNNISIHVLIHLILSNL